MLCRMSGVRDLFFFTCKEKNNGEVSFSLPSTQKHFPLPAIGWRKSWIELSHFEQKKERSLFSLQPLLLWSAKVGVQVMSRGKNTSSSIISCGCVNLGTYCLRSTFGKSNDHFALCNFSSTQWLYITIDGGSCFKKEAKSCLNCLTSRGRRKWLQKKRKVNDCFFLFVNTIIVPFNLSHAWNVTISHITMTMSVLLDVWCFQK